MEALVPGVAEEFRAISERLGNLYQSNPGAWKRLYDNTRPLFKVGCDFGEALEALQEAREVLDVDAEREAMDKARGIWAVMETYAQDENQETASEDAPTASEYASILARVRTPIASEDADLVQFGRDALRIILEREHGVERIRSAWNDGHAREGFLELAQIARERGLHDRTGDET